MSNTEHTTDLIQVTFWGVRGSKPTPGKDTMLYGGNTSCIQAQINNRTILFDAGTGIVEFGNQLMRFHKPVERDDELNKHHKSINADVFFSHLHWDHIQGIPFFQPLYSPLNTFRFYGESKNDLSLKEIIEMQMQSPHFPITMRLMKSSISFNEITANQTVDLGDGITVTTFAVNHPNGCLAYKLQYKQYSIVYCTDTEHITGDQEQQFVNFIKDTNLFIYDCHYTNDEYTGVLDGFPKYKWGHSTWEEGVRLSHIANVECLALFHHKENRTDNQQSLIEQAAKKAFSKSIAAREGMTVFIGGDKTEKVVIYHS
ncbi:hypothetical protein BHU72_04110 [Desulfuribacillus stibiiarsenatis]|uniref:Metallo-beta-lactamase domain-containing protein n=1 Tax=Desulfuribacillus stibiiarsenatis TaxID=1390249 RepID=A0A1E5L5E9_9FIRM|nr:MBL fold metallo-hydrolase [Desulfuribacillus stibiiarsenatis]OEH85288.1 hypothetical protein BHU72_04110 [Desulfuribacillus stibiiarsenatis]